MLEAIQSSSLAQLITSGRWAVTANSKQILETLHFAAFAVQIGVIMVISLRRLGLGRSVPMAALARPALRTAWLAFAVVLVTGTRSSSSRSPRRSSIGRRSRPRSPSWA